MEKHDSDADDKDDNNNGHVNVVEDNGLSVDNNNKVFRDSQQHDSDFYYSADNESETDRSDEDSDTHSDDPDEVNKAVTQSRRPGTVTQSRLPGMISGLAPKVNKDELD